MKISFNNNIKINFSGTQKNLPVYALDSNKTLQKFDTRKEAAITLGVDVSSISEVLSKKMLKTGDYTFLTPEEVENVSASGTVQIDPVKVQIAYYKINPAVYVIDKEGKYTWYPSQIAAARELNLAPSSVSRCINTATPKCKGFAIASAMEIEKLDKDGKVIINQAKIEELAKTLTTENAYYVIEEDGSFKRYSSPEETSEKTGVGQEILTKGFNGFKKVVGKQTFVKAKNLETKIVNGKPVLDEDKLITLYIGNRHAFFAIDENGNTTLFQSHAEAYGKLGASFSSITSCLNGKIRNAEGYTYAKPTQVLSVNNQNQIAQNKDKINSLLFERFNK